MKALITRVGLVVYYTNNLTITIIRNPKISLVCIQAPILHDLECRVYRAVILNSGPVPWLAFSHIFCVQAQSCVAYCVNDMFVAKASASLAKEIWYKT